MVVFFKFVKYISTAFLETLMSYMCEGQLHMTKHHWKIAEKKFTYITKMPTLENEFPHWHFLEMLHKFYKLSLKNNSFLNSSFCRIHIFAFTYNTKSFAIAFVFFSFCSSQRCFWADLRKLFVYFFSIATLARVTRIGLFNMTCRGLSSYVL